MLGRVFAFNGEAFKSEDKLSCQVGRPACEAFPLTSRQVRSQVMRIAVMRAPGPTNREHSLLKVARSAGGNDNGL